MFILVLTVLFSKWVLFHALPVNLVPNDSCVTPSGNNGRCIPVTSCYFIGDFVNSTILRGIDDKLYLERFRCGQSSITNETLACCPEFQSVDGCGLLKLEEHIIGGSETDPDEFPWTALLMYSLRGIHFFNCGGTLINGRYVLTAAHCVKNTKPALLKAVRLGAWDVTECTNCNQMTHQDFVIDKIIVHERFDERQANREHDIALIKLAKPVKYSDSIYPICLPTLDMANVLDVEHELFEVVGWGVTEDGWNSDRKQQVTLQGQHNSKCQTSPIYAKANVTITNNHLCVGGENGKDTCRGDSGGPLMVIIDTRWRLAGIVSLGPRKCGSDGVPGIYTRLGSYLEWVAANIELGDRP